MTSNRQPPNFGVPSPSSAGAPPTFTILVKATGKRVDGLTIEETIEPSRDHHGAEASVAFITKAGKRWKVRLSEFSFVFTPKTLSP